MSIRFDDQVAIVTGAGNGLGKSHALALAARGAKVVVNDLGSTADGTGASSTAAEAVAEEIRAAGGEAIAHGANVTKPDEVEDMVNQALGAWGRVDVLINNAGILRDKSFAKMDLIDFRLVADVHFMGTVNCTKAVWAHMRDREYGRIVMTTSSSGMYGNFGQSNYGAAKMAVLGLMQTLRIEGEKANIRINALSPGAATRMTEDLLQDHVKQLMTVEPVSQGMIALCHADGPSGVILNAQAGSYSVTELKESQGIWLPPEQQTAEAIAGAWPQIADQTKAHSLKTGSEHVIRMLTMAAEGLGHKA